MQYHSDRLFRPAVSHAVIAALMMFACLSTTPDARADDPVIEITGVVQSGGGGTSQGGDFSVTGSVGEIAGTPMQGGAFGFASGFFAATAPVCELSDCNCDGTVDGADLGLLLLNWGPCSGSGRCVGDTNLDGQVDGADMGDLLAHWG